MATSRDIAELAGVSQSTVSRVLRGKQNVSEKARQKVLAVLRSTAYVPNEQARAMRTRRSNVIGVVSGRITNPFYPELLDELALAIGASKRNLALWTTDSLSGEIAAVEAIRGKMVDGLIFTTVTPESSVLRQALADRLPVVLVNRVLPESPCDQVTSDNVVGARAVAEYFVRNGRSRLAVIGGQDSISTGRERRAGFLDGLEACGVPRESVQVVDCDFAHDAAVRAADQLCEGPTPPDGVFCVNDLIAFGVLDGVRRHRVAVPEEMWVVGYDDVAIASWEAYDLTTVRQPVERLAQTSIELLQARMEVPTRPFVSRRVHGEPIPRGSTGKVPFDVAQESFESSPPAR